MTRYRAAWILPITAAPIAGGVVAIDRDLVVSAGAYDGGAVEDLGQVAILPGLVNAHTHLELSWMRGLIPPNASMPAWAAALMALRRTVSHEPAEPIVDAIAEARRSGTSLLGDVTNTFATYEPLLDSELSAVLFRELLGFKPVDPDAMVRGVEDQMAALTPVQWLRPSIVPHAPYSVAPALMRAIGRANGERPLSVHLGESAQELEFLRDGSGDWRMLLEALGVWEPAWAPPGCGPVPYLDDLGLVNERLLAVHGVHFTEAELARLASAGATVVTCPRSNRWTGAGVPPVAGFYASGVRVAIGTDSLASVEDLNVFGEMAEVRRLAPGVPASRILESGTLAGAQALGFASELGSIEPGKRAQLLAVRLPPDCADVEEYLLGGVEPRDVQWLDR
ncbi:MAG TPA: amidohydrolase family protein [Vicinamibacterales bacterium]|jgi:cytosine/adenosine deaminase-related metal-dependent hydrolase